MAQVYALQSASYNQSNSAYKRECRLVVVLTNVAGVITISTARSAAGFTVTTGANGIITGTMPKAARGILLTQGLSATASNVLVASVTTFNPTAGTFSLQNHNDGAETILAVGDELFLYFILEGS